MKSPSNKQLCITTAAIIAALFFCLRKSNDAEPKNSSVPEPSHKQESVTSKNVTVERGINRRVTRSHEKKEIDLGEYAKLSSDLHTRIQYDKFNENEIKVSTLDDENCKMTLCEIEEESKIGITYDKNTGKYAVTVFSKNGKIFSHEVEEDANDIIGFFDSSFTFNPQSGDLIVCLSECENPYTITYNGITKQENCEIAKSITVQTVEKTEEAHSTTEHSKTITTNFDYNDNVISIIVEGGNSKMFYKEEQTPDGIVIKRTESETTKASGNLCFKKRTMDAYGNIATKDEIYIKDQQGEITEKRILSSVNGREAEVLYQYLYPYQERKDMTDYCFSEYKTQMKDTYMYEEDDVIYVNRFLYNGDGPYTLTQEKSNNAGEFITDGSTIRNSQEKDGIYSTQEIEQDRKTIDAEEIKPEEPGKRPQEMPAQSKKENEQTTTKRSSSHLIVPYDPPQYS